MPRLILAFIVLWLLIVLISKIIVKINISMNRTRDKHKISTEDYEADTHYKAGTQVPSEKDIEDLVNKKVEERLKEQHIHKND